MAACKVRRSARATKLGDLISSRTSFQKPFYLAYDEYERLKDLQFIKDLFMTADENGNGTLEYKEFARCMSHPATFRIFNERFGLQRHQTPVVFRAFDLDGSGSISLPEWFETCTFLMQVVKDGDVITNWRQKDIRALKDNWATNWQQQYSLPGTPLGGRDQGLISGTSQPTSPKSPKCASATPQRRGSRLCQTAPAVLGRGKSSSSVSFVAEDVANCPQPSVADLPSASAPAGMLSQGAGGAKESQPTGGPPREDRPWPARHARLPQAASRGAASTPSAARGGMLRRELRREPSSPSGQWREPSTPPYWLTRSQSAPQGATRPGVPVAHDSWRQEAWRHETRRHEAWRHNAAAQKRSSSEAQPASPSRAKLGGTAVEELEDQRRRLAATGSRGSGASLSRAP